MVIKNKIFQNKLQKILIRNFDQLKEKNAEYSLRKFSKSIGISVTAVSEIMHGKRTISVKTAAKLLLSLDVTDEERDYINRLAIGKSAIDTVATDFIHLDAKQYAVISDWYYFAILSLAETDDYNGQLTWIAKRLKIPEENVEQALKNFEEMDIFRKGQDGIPRPSKINFKMLMDRAIFINGHKENLRLAEKHMITNFDLSDYSSITMAIDCELIPEAKELILNFRRQLMRFLESGKKTEVYKLNIQLFPLTLGDVEDHEDPDVPTKPKPS